MNSEKSKENSYVIPDEHKKQITDERLEVFEQVLIAVGINKSIVNIVSSYLYSWYLPAVFDFIRNGDFCYIRLKALSDPDYSAIETVPGLGINKHTSAKLAKFLDEMKYPRSLSSIDDMKTFIRTVPIFSPNVKTISGTFDMKGDHFTENYDSDHFSFVEPDNGITLLNIINNVKPHYQQSIGGWCFIDLRAICYSERLGGGSIESNPWLIIDYR